ncbi:MAG: hypothetical protein VYE22_09155 [Myxococcota bacterium]|nr:hypothetical protein [Myxococcota bacterium]
MSRVLLASLSFLIGSTAALASAQSVAVAPFEGRASGAVERLVSRAIGDRADVVSRGRVRSAARRAGVEGTAEAGVADLARDVGADMVVQGSVSGPRRRMRVELVFRDAEGRELVRGDSQVARGRRAQRAFSRDVEQLFDRARAELEARQAEPEPAVEPEPIAPVASEAPVEPSAPAEPAPEDGLALVAVTAGAVIRTRDADVQLASGGHRGYELASGAYAELLAQAEVRPFAAESHLGRGLWIEAAFAHSVGLQSETSSGGTMVETTNFLRFSAGAGFLLPADPMVEIGLGFGGGYDGYHLGSNVVLPTAEYGWLRPGLRARIRFLKDETLVLDAGAGYRAVLGVGALATSFGEQTESHGFDIGVGLTGNLLTVADLGLTWGARFDFVGYWTSFAGTAMDEPATSGAETSLRFTLVAGWSFR